MPEKVRDRVWVLHLQLFNKAIQQYEKQQLENAVKSVKKAIWIEPNDADAYYFMYLCQSALNQKQQVLRQSLSIVKGMNPLCQNYTRNKVEGIKRLKRIINSSIKFEEKILEQNDQLQTSCWYNYSVMLHEQTNYQRVQELYQRLFKKYPYLYTTKSHAFLGNYANMLYDVGKYQQALEKYQIEIKLDPSQFRYFSNCAMLYTIIGNYEKAEEYIKIALNGMPHRTSFIFNYSNILFKMGKYEQSIQKTKLAISKQPSDPIFRLKLCITLIVSSFSEVNVNFAKQNLKKTLFIFARSINQNKAELVNCNKRILSMKNIECLNLFCMKFLQILDADILYWKYFKQVLNIISDFMVMGQASKIILNNRILYLIKCTLDEQELKKKTTICDQDQNCEKASNNVSNKLSDILFDWQEALNKIIKTNEQIQ